MAQNNLEPVTIKDAGIFLPPSRGLVLSKTKSLMLYKYPTTQSKTTHQKKKKTLTISLTKQISFSLYDMDQTNQYFSREKEIPTFPSLNHQFSRSHFPRKAIPILISLSLFALLFSFSSYIPFLLSTFSLEVLLSYSTDRKYIFLLCNGILAFLITKSGLIAKTPLVIVRIENRIGEFRRKELELSLRKEPSTEVTIEVEEKKEEEKEEEVRKDNGIFLIANEEHEDEQQENKFHDTKEEEEEKEEEEDEEEEEEEEENKFDDTVEEEEEEENKFDDNVEVEGEGEEEEEEEEEEGIGFLSLEELNNKCDAFIKLMREGIKI